MFGRFRLAFSEKCTVIRETRPRTAMDSPVELGAAGQRIPWKFSPLRITAVTHSAGSDIKA
jgi:hypothetical protein